MKAEIEKLIASTDSILALLRECWMEAKTSAEREGWMGRINVLLDERLVLMKRRDSSLCYLRFLL